MVLAKQSKAAKAKPRGTGSEKNKVGRGTAKMKAAADKALENNSDKIAQSLVKKTIAGNSTSARLLFALAEGQIDCEDEPIVQRLTSLAQELALEPEWDGELDEAEAEAGMECANRSVKGRDRKTSAAS
jgi:hypothetical protein